ncbi:MAG TPA: hypothetical protein DGT21_12160 [Armatimonadetes bacterium]|nr:hypothetical protein [Armatimonadota bacterium]
MDWKRFVVVLVACLGLTGVCLSADSATFGGMTCVPLAQALLDEVGQAYGEPCGVGVEAVAEGSLAAISCVRAGDVLISVRLPAETDYYPIAPSFTDFAQFAGKTQASTEMRLLLLRKQDGQWARLECVLGTPIGGEVPQGQMEGHQQKLEDYVPGSAPANFVPDDPDAVLATTATGEPLYQRDCDIFGSLMEWAFRTRLTQAQREAVKQSMIGYWQQGTPQDVQGFTQGVRMAPAQVGSLPLQVQEAMRPQYAQVFIGLAQGDPNNPMAQVIIQVASGAMQVLAGAGTPYLFTRQDAESLVEYFLFQYLMASGIQLQLTPEQRQQFIQQAVAQFNAGSEQEKKQLSEMDRTWMMVRMAWEQAQAQQQQALAAQWQAAYQQQLQAAYQQQLAAGAALPAGGSYWPGSAGYGGGEMSDDQFNTVLGAMNNLHNASMSAIGAIDGSYDYDVYSNDGLYLYSY